MKRSRQFRKGSLLGRMVAVFAIVFNLNTLMVQGYFTNAQYAVLSLSVILVAFIVCWLNRKLVIPRQKGIPLTSYCLICFILILLTSWSNSDLDNILYLVIGMEILKAALIVTMIDFRDFAKIYVYVVTFLAAASLIGFTLVNISPSFFAFAHIVPTSGRPAYSFFGLYYYLMDSNRNTGFLSEPGDFQHYVNTALFFFLFYVERAEFGKRMNRLIPAILSFAAFTTLSPIAIILMAIIWLTYMVTSGVSFRRIVSYSVVAILLAVLFANVSFFSEGLQYSQNKVSGNDTSSLEIRLLSMVGALQVFFESPILGMGITRASNEMMRKFATLGFAYDQTSTTAAYLAMFGLFAAICFSVPYAFMFWKSLKGNFSPTWILLIIGGFFLSINDERLIYELTYYIFVMYGVVLSSNKSSMKRTNS